MVNFGMGKVKKKLQKALVEQAWTAYKYGYIAATHDDRELSKSEFCRDIKKVMDKGKQIKDFMPIKLKEERFPGRCDK